MDGIPTPALPSALDTRTGGRGYPAPPAGPSYEIIEREFKKLFLFKDLKCRGASIAVRQGCLTSYEAGLADFAQIFSNFARQL